MALIVTELLKSHNSFQMYDNTDSKSGPGPPPKQRMARHEMARDKWKAEDLNTEHVHDRSALLDSIKACGKQKNIIKGSIIHSECVQSGLDSCVSAALISMYAKCGALAEAQDVFDDLSVRNAISWTALISGYSQHDLFNEALNCFQKMKYDGVLPDAITFSCVLKACCKLRSLKAGVLIHHELRNRGFLEKDISLGNMLVNMYAKCGNLMKAQEVFDQLQMRNIVTWNTLIAGYVRNGLVHKALNCFEDMKNEGFDPNNITFTCILRACGNARLIDKGEDIHFEISNHGFLEKDIGLGNAILDMYARCGDLVKAKDMLHNLRDKNVISWNTLIAGCVEHGLHDEALNCFRKMQDEGISPDAVTFTCILRSLGSTSSLMEGEEIHERIKKEGLLQNDVVLGTALVDMYAKCGNLRKAQAAFDELPIRNIISWNALISGYTQQSLNHEALKCFENLQSQNLSPDSVTFACVLKACGNTGSIKKGEEIHAEIEKQGLCENNVILGTALVDMYAKCGALIKAHDAFDKLDICNVSCWNALIAGCCQHGCHNEAVKLFEKMQDQGVCPDAFTFSCILKACANIGFLKKGEIIHAQVNKQGLPRKDIILGTSLIDMYAKCGVIKNAQVVFDELQTRSVISWNALIAGCVQHGLSDEAFHYFQKMQDEGLSPDAVTFACILQVCGETGSLDKGEEMHVKIKEHGWLLKDVILGTALMDMYAKCNALMKAQDVLHNLPTRNAISWNVLISGYARYGLVTEALNCLKCMREEGFSPDTGTFTSILKACGNTGLLKKGEEVHDQIRKAGLLGKDIALSNCLIDMYTKCGTLAKAQDVFDSLTERNLVSWNALIDGYAQNGFSDLALECFEKLKHEGFTPDAITFSSALKACGNISSIATGDEIYAQVRSQGLLEKDILLGIALVDMYGKCGSLTKAQEVFNKLPIQDTISWTVLIAGFAQIGRFEMAFISFKKMIANNMLPNLVTFIALLTACSHAGLVEEGQVYYDCMTEIYYLTPTLGHHTCIVDLLSRAGHFEKAMEVICKVPSSDCIPLWSAVLAGCRKCVNVEVARLAFEQLVQVDEKFAPAYITMQHVYEAAGMQEQSVKIEKLRMQNTIH